MMHARILVIEDDARLGKLLEQELAHEGYEVALATNGTDGLIEAESKAFELIVLDLNLPDLDGLEVAERLAGRTEASILMLTARGDVESRVKGLYAGASDYLTKPFSLQELLARVHVRLRERQQEKVITLGELALNLTSRSVSLGGEALALTAQEYHLLELLMKNRGRIFSKEDLEARIYEGDRLPGSNTVEVFISNLRKKLAQRGVHDLIQTVRKMGYFIR
jgi:DNA-binding response OmpR family regulator